MVLRVQNTFFRFSASDISKFCQAVKCRKRFKNSKQWQTETNCSILNFVNIFLLLCRIIIVVHIVVNQSNHIYSIVIYHASVHL